MNGDIYVSLIPGERPRYQKKSTHPAPVRGSDDRNVIWAGIETSNGRTERPEKDGWASKAGNLGGTTGGDAIILILCGVCLCHSRSKGGVSRFYGRAVAGLVLDIGQHLSVVQSCVRIGCPLRVILKSLKRRHRSCVTRLRTKTWGLQSNAANPALPPARQMRSDHKDPRRLDIRDPGSDSTRIGHRARWREWYPRFYEMFIFCYEAHVKSKAAELAHLQASIFPRYFHT